LGKFQLIAQLFLAGLSLAVGRFEQKLAIFDQVVKLILMIGNFL
jgi:hypothetical protein